jgi:hypothetical protein
MLYDPSKEAKPTNNHKYDKKVWTRLKNIKQSMFLKKEKKDE